MSAIFYHDDAQKRLALETRAREEARRRAPIATEISQLGVFTRAEDYHQKYALRQDAALVREFSAMYPEGRDFVASTAAARVNGYLGGHGTREALTREIDALGLSDGGRQRLLASVR
jgi:hypothetical protein